MKIELAKATNWCGVLGTLSESVRVGLLVPFSAATPTMANGTSGADGSTRFDGWGPGDRSGDIRMERRGSSHLAGLGGGGRSESA